MQYRAIEPGLLGAFQFFIGFRLIVTTLYFILAPTILKIMLPFPFFGMMSAGLLFFYLSYPPFRQKLGLFFLPIAFAYATLDAMLLSGLWRSVLVMLQEPAVSQVATSKVLVFTELLSQIWQVSPPLFVILVLLGWQYEFRHVLVYCAFTAVIDLFIPARILDMTDPQQIASLTASILSRTASFVIVGYVVTRLMSVQRQQRQQLQAANSRIATYAAMTESLTTSRERNRMARELHDTLAHTLSATSVQLEAVNSLWNIDSEKAHDVLQGALSTTRSGLTETRRALQSLRATPLEDLGLLLALRDLVEITRQRCGTEVTVVLPEQVTEMSQQVEQTIYRVAQESLENIVRHANAQHVELRIEERNDQVHLEIVDDGVGFDLKQVDQDLHLGIRGMFERIRALGGNLEIISAPGNGTKIELELRVL